MQFLTEPMEFSGSLRGLVCLAVFLAAGLGAAARADDPTRFLSGDSVQVTGGEAVDLGGNHFRVMVGGRLSNAAQIGVSLLNEAIALPNLAAYPIFLPGTLRPAVLRPALRYDAYDREKLSGEQAAELMGHAIVGFVTGNGIVRPENIAMMGGHFVTVDMSQAFRGFTGAGHIGVAQDYFSVVDPSVFKRMSPAEVLGFMVNINRTLSRLESLDDKDLGRLFGYYETAINEKNRASAKREVPIIRDVARRIRGARAQLIIYLQANGLPAWQIEPLKRPMKVPKPLVRLPDFEVSREARPRKNAWKSDSPIDKLWGHYFHQGKPFGADTVARLLKEAANDSSRIYEVSPHMEPSLKAPESDRVPQTALNPLNRNTLVVVPLNDEEAIEIARVAKDAGAEVLKLPIADYPHGSKLDPNLMKLIAAKLKADKKLTRVVVVELPAQDHNLKQEKALARMVPELFIVDHHDYKAQDLNRYKPVSSLEQMARLLGWKLSPSSRAIAAYDRGFVYLLLELGVPKEIAAARALPHGKELEKLKEKVESAKPIETVHGPLYIMKNFDGSMGDTAAYLAIRDYPKVANLLFIDRHSLRFSGNPKMVEGLTVLGKFFESKDRPHFSGGDASRSMYWGLKEIPTEMVPQVIDGLTGYLHTVSDARFSREDLMPERPKAPTPPKKKNPPQPAKRLQEVFAIMDPAERGKEWVNVRWDKLQPWERDKLLELAPLIERWATLPLPEREAIWRGAPGFTSFDLGAIVKIAAFSGDERWLRILDKFVEDWKFVTRGWQTFIRGEADHARRKIRGWLAERKKRAKDKGTKAQKREACGEGIGRLALPYKPLE